MLDPTERRYTSTWFGSSTIGDVEVELQKLPPVLGFGGHQNGGAYAIYPHNMCRTSNSNEEFAQYIKSITES